MNAIKSLIAAAMVLVSVTANAQGIVYQHSGPHHRTTIVLPFNAAPQGLVIPQPRYPVGTRLHVLCQKPGWPTDYRGQAACRLPNGRLVAPLRVEVEGNTHSGYDGGSQGWYNNENAYREYAPAGVNINRFCEPNGCNRDERGWYRN